ncbi:hypothetical protein L1987_30646 [Smallanthus sonchifolius]|uniref:Uncharacterized protein n=1 Tax=Smallanthus sonchifolius TaxID=185202 RepID=A0ACB9I491_9ASTR|nr:hypothetical protein L1987_30646 [Smallanthus sonchifolius]
METGDSLSRVLDLEDGSRSSDTLTQSSSTLFDIDVENSNVCKVINSYMARAWRSYRAKLHDRFKEIGGSEDPTKTKTTPSSNITKEDWEYLCSMWRKCKKRRLWHVESENWIAEMVRRVHYTVTLSVDSFHNNHVNAQGDSVVYSSNHFYYPIFAFHVA